MNLRANRWPGANHWQAAADPDLAALAPFDALEALLNRSECVVVGTDGGGLDDLFGFNVLGREPGEIELEIEIKQREFFELLG